ncbi:MAG: hypothetical protein QW468_03840 [Candidatus Bathyarchaeia archaeon]
MASGSRWRNAPPRRVPEENPTKALNTRFNKLSFKPIKITPMKAMRLTATTDAKIAVKTSIDVSSTLLAY